MASYQVSQWDKAICCTAICGPRQLLHLQLTSAQHGPQLLHIAQCPNSASDRSLKPHSFNALEGQPHYDFSCNSTPSHPKIIWFASGPNIQQRVLNQLSRVLITGFLSFWRCGSTYISYGDKLSALGVVLCDQCWPLQSWRTFVCLGCALKVSLTSSLQLRNRSRRKGTKINTRKHMQDRTCLWDNLVVQNLVNSADRFLLSPLGMEAVFNIQWEFQGNYNWSAL